MSIDNFVDQALLLSRKKEHDQLEVLFLKHMEVLIKNARSWGSILEAARGDPVANTMILAVVGGLRATQSDADAKIQVVAVTELLVFKGDFKQLARRELVQGQFRNLIHKYVSVMREAKEFKRALKTLNEGLACFAPQGHLSAFHPGFVQLCLLTQNPNAALPLLGQPIFEVDPTSTGVKAVDFMAYYYYGGVAYLALRNIAKAREFFSNVFAVPAQAVSLVMVLAFKALSLINAIAEPRPVTFPNHMDARHERTIRQLSQPYTDLVAALESRDDAAVAKLLETERTTFEADDLSGLVQQALDAAPRQAILALTRIYVALTLDQIAEQVKVPKDEVEKLLGSMIARGDIDATIDAAGTVKFGQGRVPQLADISADLERAQELSQQIRDIDDQVVTSRPYVMAKLRQMPNLREVLADFETRRKANRSLAETVQDAFRGAA